MRIALLTQDFPPDIGGIQTYAFELAKRLAKQASDFYVFAPQKPNSESVDQALGFDVVRIDVRNELMPYLGGRKVLKVLADRPVDILFHVQWQSIRIGIKAKSKGYVKELYVAAHAREFFFNPYESVPLLGRWFDRYKKNGLQKVDFFLPVSQFTANELINTFHINPAKIQVVLNGTNPDQFYPMDASALKNELKLAGKFVLLCLSRLVHRKGVDLVMQSVQQLKKEIPSLYLLIVGDGPSAISLKQMSEELGLNDYVLFTGKVKHEMLNSYYNISDVFCLPARAIYPDVEGFGIVFLEANAAGKPVIGSATGGIPSAVVDGETGFLIPENDVDALSDKIRILYNDETLRIKLGQQGRDRVLKTANWDQAGLDIYRLMDKSS